MDTTGIPGLTEGLIFFYIVEPIILLFWFLFEIRRFRQSFTKGRPVALAIVSALIVSYIFARASNFHGGEYNVVDGILAVIILGAGLLERARRKTPFGPNSLAISVIASIIILYAWNSFTSGMSLQPAPTVAYILVVICLALGLYGRRVSDQSQRAKSRKGSKN